MGKYLHYYETLNGFEKDYNDESGIKTFVCSAGTFTYDRYENEMGGAYFWKNGDKELITNARTPKVGPFDYNAGTGAWDLEEEEGVEITAVGEIEPGKYVEPWVSYTTHEKQIKVEASTLYSKESSGPYFRGSNLTITPMGKAVADLGGCQ
jgi:hypothetical protein